MSAQKMGALFETAGAKSKTRLSQILWDDPVEEWAAEFERRPFRTQGCGGPRMRVMMGPVTAGRAVLDDGYTIRLGGTG